jgi:spermidine/putrescine transport system substrate-binding protein
VKFLLNILFLSLILTGCQSSPLPELHVFMWSDYIKPGIIKKFEKEHHCTVVVDTYDSNEAMYAKLKLGSAGYDLIFPSNYFFDILNQQNMLQTIDFDVIPNYKNLDPAYSKFTKPSMAAFGVPYMVSLTGIAYRTDRISNLNPSWGVFALPQYHGRITMLNDIREAIGAGLRYLGYSTNTQNANEITEASQLLIQWKKNLAKFESEQYKNGIASAEYLVVQGYNGDVLQIMQENPNVAFVYPEEGTMMSIDYLAIPRQAPNAKLAHAFINFLLEENSAAENMAFTFFLSPNSAAYEKLEPKLRQNPLLFPPKEVLNKVELIKNLDQAYPLYIKAWERIKSAD